jgi:hypothetical protein
VGEKEEWIGHNLKYWNCVSAVHSGTFFLRKRTFFYTLQILSNLNAV